MCTLEVEGARNLLPACATLAMAGMVIRTESGRTNSARRTVLELLLASGNHDCLICEANGAWFHNFWNLLFDNMRLSGY
jgi:NADH dehydrogenase/NADH:ubiquinone oxidoreductase subunit G